MHSVVHPSAAEYWPLPGAAPMSRERGGYSRRGKALSLIAIAHSRFLFEVVISQIISLENVLADVKHSALLGETRRSVT